MNESEIELITNTLQLSITEGCDSHCVYCNFWKIDEPTHISMSDIDLLFDVIDYENIELLCVTGGEPTEHPEIKEIIKKVSDKIDRKVLLSTNSLNYERLESIVEEVGDKIHTISTSLDGDKKTHDKNRGVKGAYDNVFRAVELADSKGISTKFAITVVRSNMDEVTDLLNRFGDERLDIKTAHTSAEYYGDNTEKIGLQKQKRSVGERLYQAIKSYYLENEVNNLYTFYNSLYVMHGVRPVCNVALTEFFVFPNGDIYACYSKEKLANLKKVNKEELNQRRLNFYETHKNCTDCFARCSSSIVLVLDNHYKIIADNIIDRWRMGEEMPEKDYFEVIRNPLK